MGIGASAGGLNALTTFFDVIGPDTGMAFVVDTHLHPEHESHMAEQVLRHLIPLEQESASGGLMRLRHRLSFMGGNLQDRSQPGDDTQVIIDIQPKQGNL